ncbi:MAG: S10 family peptidase [Vulcanimicrobiaceae bacterium]
MKILRLLTCATLAAASMSLPALAAKTQATPAWLKVPDSVTQHSMMLRGKKLNYTARAGTIVLRNSKQQPLTTMFYTAYTVGGIPARKRPITFLYNGGPGSSTIYLRMGSWGPIRAQITRNGGITPPAPYTLVSNQYTLLNKTDLVFVDMPASGYGRIWPGADAKKVFGSDNDVRMFAQFIDRYLKKFDRWNSPKFLYGESYGTPRSAMLVNYLQHHGVSINGVVLQSSILNYNLASPDIYGGASTDDWQYVFQMATEAATAWYYHAVPGASANLSTYMQQVQAFAMGQYREALLKGAQISPVQYNAVVAKLHYYLAIPKRYIRDSNLRIPAEHYIAEFRRSSGKIEDIYDSRYQLYTLDRGEEYPSMTPSNASIASPFFMLQNEYMQKNLKYRTPLMYRMGAYKEIQKVGPWNFKHDGSLPLNTAPDLAQALTYNPHLRVFSANGYFDSVTPFLATVYTLNHLNLAPQLQSHISYGFYPSGHMIYLNVVALAQLHRALERWYTSVLAIR